MDVPGHDACCLRQEADGWVLQGTSVFLHQSEPAQICYVVRCDSAWRTVSGRIDGFIGQIGLDYTVARQGGHWTFNGVPVAGLGHLLDLDLGFTPATNLLQMRRVLIGERETVPLPVAWFNLDSRTLTELPQVYEHRSQDEFWYRAPSVGYEGLLKIAPNGFIGLYPGLWEAEVLYQG
jgi:hypothetical protein